MAILRQKNNYFCESFTNPTFIFRGGLMFKSFAKSVAPKNTFANSEKNTFVGSHVTLAAFVMDNLYMDL